jgi:hypothetical protein
MNSDLSVILSLRRALESAGKGEGMSRSIIEALREANPVGSESAKLLLLGYPLSLSLRPLVEGSSREVSMLASLIISAPRSSTPLVGRNGEAMARTFERWAKARESRRIEDRVMRFRSFVTSAVMGAVTSMVAILGPLVGSLSFMNSGSIETTGSLLPAAAAMTAIGSGMLGVFMSGRKFYANVAISLLVFSFVAAVASPLAAVPSVNMWGVK